MNVNFEAIEKEWSKPKNKILFTKEELELLEDVFSLAIGECPSEDIKKIDELEQKIKTYSGAWFKPKKTVLDELEKYLENEIKEYKKYGYDTLETRHEYLWLAGCYDEDKYILNKIQELKKENENGKIF